MAFKNTSHANAELTISGLQNLYDPLYHGKAPRIRKMCTRVETFLDNQKSYFLSQHLLELCEPFCNLIFKLFEFR